MGKLRAGIARAVTTPPEGIDLCGYAGRIPGNIGVHDDLQAKAIVLDDGRIRSAIVTLDLVGLNADQIAWIRQEASDKTGIPEADILIGASHTHAGPASQTIRACGHAAEGYVGSLLRWIVEVIDAASENMRPVRFGIGSGQSTMAINRRQARGGSGIDLGENPDGIVDHEVAVWYFADENDKPFATIFNYACHAVVMGGDNRLVSADWPGVTQRMVEERIGGQAMFLQGCCGNINPRYRGTFEEVERAGAEVAEAVIGAIPGIRLMDDAQISIASETVQLPLEPPMSLEEAEEVIRTSGDKLAQDIPLWEQHIQQAYRDWAEIIISRGGERDESIPFEIQRISVDDAHLVGLPGEVFVDYALALKKVRPNVMVSGYTNGNVGYVPAKYAFAEGGYEVDLAYKLYAEQMFKPEIEDVILDAGSRLLKK